MVSRETIKSWFQQGSKPLAEHFSQWIDSFWHKQDTITISNISGLANRLSTIESRLSGKADLATQEKLIDIVRHCPPVSVTISKGNIEGAGMIESSSIERFIKQITVNDKDVKTIKYHDEYNTIDVEVGKDCEIPVKPGKSPVFIVDLASDPLDHDVVVTLHMEYNI